MVLVYIHTFFILIYILIHYIIHISNIQLGSVPIEALKFNVDEVVFKKGPTFNFASENLTTSKDLRLPRSP